VIDGGEDRGGDGGNGFFGAAPGAQALELGLEITSVTGLESIPFECGHPIAGFLLLSGVGARAAA